MFSQHPSASSRRLSASSNVAGGESLRITIIECEPSPRPPRHVPPATFAAVGGKRAGRVSLDRQRQRDLVSVWCASCSRDRYRLYLMAEVPTTRYIKMTVTNLVFNRSARDVRAITQVSLWSVEAEG